MIHSKTVNKMQLRMLVDYMSLHKNFANGEYSGPMGSNQHLNQWVALKTQLKEYGPDKTVEQWCHTWRDLKKKVLPGFEVPVLHVAPGTSIQPSPDSLYRCSQTHTREHHKAFRITKLQSDLMHIGSECFTKFY
ncbi:hypothetical protein ABMA27_004244 [Loxostege sticticalis]|uniref:Regulatory protein zeste n=1 Tax=Loxostege sticticalis TaxID=481309 RepID=A0ABR3HMW1_LOXSC